MVKNKKTIVSSFLSHALLIIATILAVFPLVWIFLSSVKGKGELTQFPTRFFPKDFTLEYFIHVIRDLH
ncbi:carbohydrate ABC transporter permease, partial [Bacillus sp. SIMBA_005]